LSAIDVFFIILAGFIRRWKLQGHHNAPVTDDLRKAPYYTENSESPVFNQLFAALYDLILCRIPKMGILAPGSGRSIADVFEEKIPDYESIEGERYLVSPELIAYLQWLIYSAPFKSPDHGPRSEEHKKYYDTWAASFKARWGAYRKLLLKELEKWYVRFPPDQLKGRRKSRVGSQGSSVIIVDEGLPMESASDNEQGGDAAAAAGDAGGGGEAAAAAGGPGL
jgi:hypothetical protein